jgi:hypothetical protein
MWRALILTVAFLSGTSPSGAQVPVDVQLVLAIDVSLSMTADERMIQRQGYAEALVSDDVMRAIDDGFLGRIALTYMEWAGARYQRQVIGWTLIDGPEALARFAQAILENDPKPHRGTSISGALYFAGQLFEDSGFTSPRRIIDISGDGPNSSGPPVEAVRNALVARGIEINGLPIMVSDGMNGALNLRDLDRFFENCVIGGGSAFVMPVRDWQDFVPSLRRKLVLEIAGQMAQVLPAHLHVGAAYDCGIGERERTRVHMR